MGQSALPRQGIHTEGSIVAAGAVVPGQSDDRARCVLSNPH